MDFVQSLRSGDDAVLAYVTSRIGASESRQEDHFKNMYESLEERFKLLFDDEDCDEPEFLVPELPKPKKDAKGKRTSRKPKASESLKKTGRETQKQEDGETLSVNSANALDIVRKSSRLASKTSQIPKQGVSASLQTEMVCDETFTVMPNSLLPLKVEPSVVPSSSGVTASSEHSNFTPKGAIAENCPRSTADSFKWTTANESINELSSPLKPPAKIRCIESINSGKTNDNMLYKSSFNPSLKDEPLGTSTPTSSSSTDTQPETLKKAQLTPKPTDKAKKPKLKTNIYTEQSASAIKGAKTRTQDKILQEKNTNIKMIEEKCQEAQKKKEDIIKSSAEEAKRKREERYRKVAASREAALQEKVKQIQKQELEKEMKLKELEKQKEEKLRFESQKKKQVTIKQNETEKRKREEENSKLPKLKKPDSKLESVHEYPINDVVESGSSDEEERPKQKVPSWATKANRKRPLLIQGYLNRKETIRPWFFNPCLKYPKLELLFPGVNLKNRPRASSAFWNTIVDFEEAFPLHD